MADFQNGTMQDLTPLSRSKAQNHTSAGGLWLLMALIAAICGFAGILLGAEILIATSLIWSLMTCTHLNRRRLVTEIHTCTINSARLTTHEISSWAWAPSSGKFWACEHFHRLVGLSDGTLSHENDLRALIHPEDLRENIFPSRCAEATELRIKIADGSWEKITLTQSTGRATGDTVFGTAIKAVKNQNQFSNNPVPVTDGNQHQYSSTNEMNTTAVDKNKIRSEFISNLSHEIRSPLNTILGFVELLDTADIHEQRSHVRIIQRNGEHLLRLVDDTLDLSKAEEGKIELEPRVEKPAKILQELREMFVLQAEGKGLELRFDCDVSIPEYVCIDTTRFRQIIVNLVSNALRFTSKGFISARLSYDETHGDLLCEVRDSGVGISEDVIDEIFEPFQQEHISTNRTHGGTGLGLYISKKLSQLMGGDIEVRSRVGFGSSFTVRVNSPSAPSPQSLTSTMHDPKSIDGLVVLLADDAPDNRRLITHLLKKAGAQVIETANGREALDAMRMESAGQRSIDLVILDMNMPTLDGYQTARQMRHEGCGTPILALTANASREDRERCLESGCDHYLAKPIQTKKFLNEISALIHQQTPKQRAG